MVSHAPPIPTCQAIIPVTFMTAIVSVVATLWLTPDRPPRPPTNLSQFVHLTAAHLNARNLGDYRVLRATVGQEQFWITAEAGACPPEMLDKHKCLLDLPRWKGTAVVFRNDRMGIVAADANERAQGCVTTLGRFVVFGDPQLIEHIKNVWQEVALD